MDEEIAAEETIDPANLKPDIRAAYDLLVQVCEASGLDCRPEVCDISLPYVTINLVGKDVSQTFARNGQSLDALQLLCNAILAQRLDADVRIALDGAGYRAKRSEALIELARELAAEVKERNEEAELDPLPPHERRIIHSALVDDPDIMTYSEGNGSDRRIVIAPRKPAE